ncbi:hypothetical protein LCGC14_1890490 [marine sediment metagenome]|uniref:Bacteriophage SP-beta YorD domain-containing protein n=1 Tax=marine sediment metagenome TaxID=412755 RepID=A0A0F9IXU4_9ZZZZ
MSLAEVLAWKYLSPGTKDGVQNGVRTRENPDTGKWEIFDWPSKLGSEPTAAQIKKWTAEFDALPTPENELTKAADAATSIAELKTVLKDVIKAL